MQIITLIKERKSKLISASTKWDVTLWSKEKENCKKYQKYI